jgi:hypothetical protein
MAWTWRAIGGSQASDALTLIVQHQPGMNRKVQSPGGTA